MIEETIRSVGIGLFKIIFYMLMLLLAIVIIFIVGLAIGYAVIGNGHVWEVLNQDTWLHLLSFFQ